MKKQFKNASTDYYQEITNKIVAQLEAGVRPWQQPWAGGAPTLPLRHNGVPYRGINILQLWLISMDRGYSQPIWLTYNQARAVGGQVRKGEHGAPVFYYGSTTKEDPDVPEGEKTIVFLKHYTVFNAEQIDNLPAQYISALETFSNPDQRLDELEAYFSNTGADIRHGGKKAFYTKDMDFIQLPNFQEFASANAYYATLAHETTHWTRHPSRLDRDLGRKKWGDAGYAMEELVAELGAAFLAVELGLEPEPREDHAAYIASWIQVLKGDKRAIFTAASHAQRAVDFLHSKQPNFAPEPQEDDTPMNQI